MSLTEEQTKELKNGRVIRPTRSTTLDRKHRIECEDPAPMDLR